jgi:hypothetical protein
MSIRWMIVGCVWFLVGCGTLDKEDPVAPVQSEMGHEKSTFFRAAIEGEGNTPPLYAKTPMAKNDTGQTGLLPPPMERTRIRIHIDQLKRSFVEVTGGIDWVNNQGKSLFDVKSNELGVPNYMTSVIELREPTLLFVKLMGDAARDICPLLMDKDVKAEADDRVFLMEVEPTDTYATAPEAVEANLSQLVLRFHGRYYPPGDPRLSPWLNLFATGLTVTGDPMASWTAVCVALLIHPDFTSY